MIYFGLEVLECLRAYVWRFQPYSVSHMRIHPACMICKPLVGSGHVKKPFAIICRLPTSSPPARTALDSLWTLKSLGHGLKVIPFLLFPKLWIWRIQLSGPLLPSILLILGPKLEV